jgi:selenocysteine lyase/cysteine desulfurase
LRITRPITDDLELISEIRGRFAHVDNCPFAGPRIYFENGGGALTLNAVVKTSARYAAIPDNQGRDNSAAKALSEVIDTAKADLAIFMNATSGQFIAGETGTELLFRMIRTAAVNAPHGTKIIGSSIEHPSSRSAAQHWAKTTGLEYIEVAHDAATGTVTAQDYAGLMTPDVAVATILHASPVTGIGIDVTSIAKAIRAVAPDCLIVVDGIQHAAHGQIDLTAYDVDGYAISPYKIFSRHGYGLGWISERITALPHEALIGGPKRNWELGTRDVGAFAAFSDVIAYLDWLGGEVADETDRRRRIEAAGQAIHDFEADLTRALIDGTDGQTGLRHLPGITVIAGLDNPARVGTVSFTLKGVPSADLVEALRDQGIRTHTRKADHYSGNILHPLQLPDCVRLSMCHYNTRQEVAEALKAIAAFVGAQDMREQA